MNTEIELRKAAKIQNIALQWFVKTGCEKWALHAMEEYDKAHAAYVKAFGRTDILTLELF